MNSIQYLLMLLPVVNNLVNNLSNNSGLEKIRSVCSSLEISPEILWKHPTFQNAPFRACIWGIIKFKLIQETFQILINSSGLRAPLDIFSVHLLLTHRIVGLNFCFTPAFFVIPSLKVAKVPMPIGKVVRQVYERAKNQGLGPESHTNIVRMIEQEADVIIHG